MSDRHIPLRDGRVIDAAAPWPLPSDISRNLLAMAHAKSSRRFAAVPVEPTGFGTFEEDMECECWAAIGGAS